MSSSSQNQGRRKKYRDEKRPRPYQSRRKRSENQLSSYETESDVSIVQPFVPEVKIKLEKIDPNEDVEIEDTDIDEEDFLLHDIETSNSDEEEDIIIEPDIFSDEEPSSDTFGELSFQSDDVSPKKVGYSWNEIKKESQYISSDEEDFQDLKEMMMCCGEDFEELASLPVIYEEDLIDMNLECDEVKEVIPDVPIQKINYDQFEHLRLPLLSSNSHSPHPSENKSVNDSSNFSLGPEDKKERQKKMYRKRITDPKLLAWYSRNLAASQKYFNNEKLVNEEIERENLENEILRLKCAEKDLDPKYVVAEALWNSSEKLPTFDEMFIDDLDN